MWEGGLFMRSRSAFTLIELLVVIAIIAILAAILFPVFANAKERARQVRCLNNLKQLSAAFQQYCIDSNDVMPSLSSYRAGRTPDWCGTHWLIPNPTPQELQVEPEKGQLWTYTRSRELYLCPTDYKVPAGVQSSGWTLKDEYRLSYSVNSRLMWVKFDSAIGYRATKIMLLIHEDRERINDGNFAWGRGYDMPSDVHYDGTTISFCDGHARWYNIDELTRQCDSGIWDPNYGKKQEE